MNKSYYDPEADFRLTARDAYELAVWMRDCLLDRQKTLKNVPHLSDVGPKYAPMGLEHAKLCWLGDHPEISIKFPELADRIFAPKVMQHLGFFVTDQKIAINGKKDYGISLP